MNKNEVVTADIKYKDYDLARAMKDADVFIGLSSGNCISPEMIKSMARQNPIVSPQRKS
jgi:malate dehydrogenase (oxaloacetate-decarboxylating)(NADP+)